MMDAVEGTHMGHPDFRVNGRIFATLHADDAWGMVKLTPDQQERFVSDEVLGEAISLAWRHAVARRVATRSKAKRSGRRPRKTDPST